MKTMKGFDKYQKDKSKLNDYLKGKGVSNTSDYQNIVEYKGGSQKAFNNIYQKYFKYIRRYAWNLYYEITDYDGGVSEEDVLSNLIEKCFVNQLNNIDINRIRPNFDFKVGLTKYLKAYQSYYRRKYKKLGVVYTIEDATHNTLGTMMEKTSYGIQHSNTTRINGQDLKKLAHDPTPEYIENLNQSRQTLNERLNKKEQRFVKYLEKGLTLNQIANKLHVSMGNIGKMKKELKEKCYSIVLEG